MSTHLPSVDAALAAARGDGLDRLDAQLLLAHALGQSRTWLLAHGEAALADDQVAAYAALCRRRASGVPLAYLVGVREFHGLQLAVDPTVLVPRPDTEALVAWALELLPEHSGDPARAPTVLDLGTGSGAIALALAHARPGIGVWALERSTQALATAAANAARLGLEVAFVQGDWWEGWSRRDAPAAFDLVVANPPYIAPDDPHLADLAHEPREALVAAQGGLADIVRIIQGAYVHLRSDGWLLLEHGWTQGPAVRARLHGAGYRDIGTRLDLAGHERCTGGRRA